MEGLGIVYLEASATGLPVIGGLLRAVREQYPGIDPARLTHELVRRLIGRLIEDAQAESTDHAAGREGAGGSPATLICRWIVGCKRIGVPGRSAKCVPDQLTP